MFCKDYGLKGQKVKILFAADVSIERVIGGAERVLFEQGTRLARRGNNVYILTRSISEFEVYPKVIQGVREWRYKVDLKNAFTYLKSTLQNSRDQFESLQNKISFDVIIFHQPFSALGITQSALSRKIKKVYICHSLSFEEYISRNKNPERLLTRLLYRLNVMVRRWIEKRVLIRSDTIIVLSKYTKDKLETIHHISSDRISIISGGVDLDRFKPAGDKTEIRLRLKIPEGKVVLFTVRNLVPRMGLENLIKAYSKVAKTAPDIYLVVGGDGPLKNKLMEMARELGIEDFVKFQGFIPEELLPDYYRMADLFVLPTTELEGFGLVTLEAMASGVPVLGTPVGGTVEIIGRFNPDFIFKDTASDSMAALILKYFHIIKQSPEQWNVFSKNCRYFVEKNYSWEKHIDSLEDHFYRQPPYQISSR